MTSVSSETNCSGFNLIPSTVTLNGKELDSFAIEVSEADWNELHDDITGNIPRVFSGQTLHPIFPRENGGWGFGRTWTVESRPSDIRTLTLNTDQLVLSHPQCHIYQYESLRILYALLNRNKPSHNWFGIPEDGTQLRLGEINLVTGTTRLEVVLGYRHFHVITKELSKERKASVQKAMSNQWEFLAGEIIPPESYILGSIVAGEGLNTLAKDDSGKTEVVFRLPVSAYAARNPNSDMGCECNQMVFYSHRRYGNPHHLRPDFGVPMIDPRLILTFLSGLARLA